MKKEIFQTSRYSQPEHIMNQIMDKADGWTYRHFLDEQIVEYFTNNPDQEFPDIIKKFYEIKSGPHRADLFRYFYLYQNGGLFIDTDLGIEYDINKLVKDADLMTVSSDIDKRAFNGFLYSIPKNKIIHECLKHIYKIDVNLLDENYDIICEFLLEEIGRHPEQNIVLHNWEHWDGIEFPHAMYNSEQEMIALHYWKTKQVPIRKNQKGITFSQVGQDQFILDVLDKKKNGTYVEIGAYHSRDISNTYLLERDYDWSGVSFEIVEKRVEEFNKNRKNKCYCADATSFKYKELFEQLQLPKQIDYLQVDIEPAENSLMALKALPLKEYRFSVITFEHDLYENPENINIKNQQKRILMKLGYHLAKENVDHEGRVFEDWWIDPSCVNLKGEINERK